MDFDQERIYFSHQNLQQEDGVGDMQISNENDGDEDGLGEIDLKAIRRHLREFLRNYRQGGDYIYRERLLRNRRTSTNADENFDNEGVASSLDPYPTLEVDLTQLGEYNSSLLGLLLGRPSEILPQFELAARDALQTLLYESDKGGSAPPTIQVLLRGNLLLTPLRSITAKHLNKLLLVPGIVISTSRIRSRASKVTIRCSKCGQTQTLSPSGPFSGLSLPNKCQGADPAECGPTPYAVVPDLSSFVDDQTLKLQEMPENVPTGEMPRSVLLSCERSSVDRCPPGSRVGVFGIASLFNHANANTKSLYLRVVGLTTETNFGQDDRSNAFSPAQEEAFALLARRTDIYHVLYDSIAPSISGSYTVDIKKALACMLFGGSRKRLSDGMRLRGDINVLLLGDPSTAKSQFLKFVTRAAPIGVYTSGKGSSAAGLTASVVRDARGEFYLEGGAMVLADGGVVCIDEFDKMRSNDRVAIHEAMEQQTISVAKAGITTVLNCRASVLAAANPVFGRYDDLRSAEENIDLMSTILSRFDLIFLVRDVREEERDKAICAHVMGVHMTSKGIPKDTDDMESPGIPSMQDMNAEEGGEWDEASPDAIAQNAMRVATHGGTLNVPTLKKYIQYCKARCHPRLTEEAANVLANAYVNIRDDVRKRTITSTNSQSVIPITVRQLEALVRIAESLAKMRLSTEVHGQDVSEAMRLFKVSTMAANSVDKTRLDGTTDDMSRAETFLRNRLAIGATLNKLRIVEEASARGYDAVTIAKAIAIMVLRGEVQEKNQSRLIKRIK